MNIIIEPRNFSNYRQLIKIEPEIVIFIEKQKIEQENMK